MLRQIAIWCRLRHISRLDPGAGLELDSTDLGTCAQEIVLATLQATATLQDSLLFPGALSPGALFCEQLQLYTPQPCTEVEEDCRVCCCSRRPRPWCASVNSSNVRVL